MDAVAVLIVEDDLVDRMACRRRLGAHPGARYALLEADDGAGGLALARARRPDCILLDYRLPDMTGLEFLARLAAEPDDAVRAIPVLMLTGADSAAVATEALRAGARDYLVKDADGRYLDHVAAAIERLLREQRLLRDKRQAEAKFQTLIEQIQAISYIVAPDRLERLRYISPQIRVLGYTPAEWLADPGLHAGCMLPEDRDAALAAIARSRVQGAPLRIEYRLRSRAGEVLWFRDQADVVRDEDGRPQFMQGTLIDITANKLAEQNLAQSREALRALAAYQERIKENERGRIAREIHDELGGLLTGIKAYISVVAERCRQAGQVPDPLLGDAAALAQDAMDTVRRVIADLRPSVLDQLGIWAALDWCVSQGARRSSLAYTCDTDPEATRLELDAERSIMVFRIVQEAMTNVQRHAAASSVRLQVRHADGGIVLTLEDDGRGIPADAQQSGTSWGILGMQERSRSLGGELTLAPRPGGGTVLRLVVPMEACHVP